MPAPLPTPIQTFLADFVARRRRLAVVKAAALAAAAAIVFSLVVCLIDRVLHLPSSLRAALLLVNLVGVIAIVRKPVRDAFKSHADWVMAARQVESLEPAFAQRLITVTSQLQSPESQRGSTGMLEAIVSEVSTFAGQRRAGVMLGWGRIRQPIVLVSACLFVALALTFIPWLNYPQLLARFTRPWADIPPVTTTQLAVDPGSASVRQGKPFRVMVTAARLGDGSPRVHLKQPDGWSLHDMTLAAPGRFMVDLPSMERDTQYFVTGGDARSSTYDVQVLAQPQLLEVRARVQYPLYLKWPEKSVTLSDNKLEVPAETMLNLSLVGSEPLAAATLTPQGWGTTPIETAESVDPAVRVVSVQVKRDMIAGVTLKSAKGIEQQTAQPLQIKSIPDRPPIARLFVPHEELRLTPTDVVTTAAQAMDDYGVEQMFLQIRINDGTPTYQEIALPQNRQRIEMPITCDLAASEASVGDLIQLQLLAKDGAGQQRGSDVLRVIVSPRSFDLNAYLRLADLKTASKLAVDLLAQLTVAHDQLGQSAEQIAKEGDKSLQNLGAAAQTAQLMIPPLMRAASRADSRQVGDAIAAWVDLAEQTRSVAEELQDQRSRGIEQGQIHGQIDPAVERVQRATEQMKTVLRASQAIAIRDDLSATAAVAQRAEKAKGAERERLFAAVKRLEASAQAAAKEANVGLEGAGDARPAVQRAVADAEGVFGATRPIDFGDAAREWSQSLQQSTPGNRLATASRLALVALDQRLTAAAAVEMVRPDADFARTRDLSLAGKAAAVLSGGAMISDPAAKQGAGDYPNALRDLQAEHRLHRQATPPSDAKAITAAATTARNNMRRWAGETQLPVAQADETLAIEAAALAQQREFDEAKKLDQARAVNAKTPSQQQLQQQTSRATQLAQQLEQLRQQQQQLAEQTADAMKKSAGDAESQKKLRQLARQQQQLAEAIEQQRDAAAQTEGDKIDPQNDPVVAIATARKALSELKESNDLLRKATEDKERLDGAKDVDPSATEAAAQQLAKVSPVADDARTHIEEKVIGGVRQMQQDARSRDAGAVKRRSGELDQAIAEGQKKLNAAEEKLVEKDALAAAESASQEAANQLASATAEPTEKGDADPNALKPVQPLSNQPNTQPPPGDASKNPPSQQPNTPPASAGSPPAAKNPQERAAQARAAMEQAQRAQARAAAALDRAVDRSTLSGGQARIRDLPNMDAIFSLLPLLSDVSGAGGFTGERGKVDLPAAREWGRLRPREDANQTAVLPAGDPPGYEAALRAYFDALGKDK